MGELFLTLGSMLKWLGFAAAPLLALPLLILLTPKPLGPVARRISRTIDQINTGTLRVAVALSILMVLAQVLVIIGRYIFDWSASWANEIIIYSFAGLFLIAAASALKSDAHVRVDILREKMSPKARAGVDLAGIYLFLFPICALVLWASISPSFVRSWLNLEGSRESDGLPIYFLFRTLVPAFGTLLMAQGLSEALRAALTLRGQNDETDTEPTSPPLSEGI